MIPGTTTFTGSGVTGQKEEVDWMSVRKIAHPSVYDRKAMGREARDRASLPSHTRWSPAAARPDPVALLEEQNAPASRTWCRSGTAG